MFGRFGVGATPGRLTMRQFQPFGVAVHQQRVDDVPDTQRGRADAPTRSRAGRAGSAGEAEPRRAGASENQAFARTIALQPDSWTRGNANEMAARFDELAAT